MSPKTEPLGETSEIHVAGEPVRHIRGEAESPPNQGWRFAFLGGGYRAMLFHLGVLWRLNEAGLLKTLDRVSSVSGGSITAGVLAMNWSHLTFDETGVSRLFTTHVVGPIREMASTP